MHIQSMELTIIKENYPWDLLLLADPDEAVINRYLGAGICYVALDKGDRVGVAVVREIRDLIFELMNIAVAPQYQQQGYGSRILQTILQLLDERHAIKLEVGTGTFGYPLKFYQQHGFRVTAIRKDFFLEHYTEPVMEDGLQHKDMLVLTFLYKDRKSVV